MKRLEPRPGAVLSLNLHGLGDMILTLPILDSLRRAGYGPIVSVVWPALEDFARCAGAVDIVVPLPKARENEPELTGFARELAAQYDFALTLDFAFLTRGGVLSREVKTGLRLGFGEERRGLPWYDCIIPNFDTEHRLARNLHLLERLGIDPGPGPRFVFTAPECAEERVGHILRERGLEPDELPVALHPGSGALQRNWPPERFARLADLIVADSGSPILLLGGQGRTYDGADESALAVRVAQTMEAPVTNLAGIFSLPELVALFRRCRLFVGNNSGPAHLAAAVAGTPCLLVWAPRNERVWRPVGGPLELVFEDVDCSPGCLLNRCERMQHCLGQVAVTSVFNRYMRTFSSRAEALAGEEMIA